MISAWRPKSLNIWFFLKKGRILAAGPKADTLSSRILEETYEMDVASYMRSQKKIWDEIQ
ncbi:MAG: hypothetical protein PUG16_06825 [Lachnospiraceae bacterium]|nr:hypothetical protein [Lachnospiraceae bacterium]